MAPTTSIRMLAVTVLCAAVAACGGMTNTEADRTTAPAAVLPAPALDVAADAPRPAVAVFAGGCFWGVQGVFQHVDGVLQAVSGYSGGTADTARYSLVSTGTTNHAEAVEVTFDPDVISYGTLLQIFFTVVADPTTLNAQGPDHGTQYRTEIFATTSDQARVADGYIGQLEQAKAFAAPIVTTVSMLDQFYPAEDYHQNFLTDNPDNPYIVAWDMPKLEALQRLFPDEYRPDTA